MAQSSPSRTIEDPPARPSFDALYDAHATRVYTMALHFCGDPAAAQDVTQSVFLKVYRGLGNFRQEAEVATWIRRITVNACLDHRRRERVRAFLFRSSGDEHEWVGSESDSPHARFEQNETRRRVQRALVGLPPRYRLPLLLKYLEDLSYQEIAEVLRIRVGTVGSRISRGQQLLAKRLKADDVVSRRPER